MNDHSAPRRDKPLVLVVDDFPDTVELTTEYLAFRGFEVASCTDGPEALVLAERLRPDVLLLDISLPGMSGLEVARRLKASPRTSGIRVLAFTAHALQSKEQEAREAGCDGFIAKPVAPDRMVEEVRRVLQAATPGPSVRAKGSPVGA